MTSASTDSHKNMALLVAARDRAHARQSQCRVHLGYLQAIQAMTSYQDKVAALGEIEKQDVSQIVNLEPMHDPPTFLPQSPLAHELLDHLQGLEIGGAAHNAFGLKTQNVGIPAAMEPHDFEVYKQHQIAFCGTWLPIDIPGYADSIPVPDNSQDFIVNSHVWEHLSNPLGALEEWVRVVRSGGYIFAIVPKREAADAGRALTPIHLHILHYLLNSPADARGIIEQVPSRGHYTVFDGSGLDDIETWFNLYHTREQLLRVAYQETDDKVGNGHAVVWQVKKQEAGLQLAE